MEACPPAHLGHGVVHKVSMRVIYKSSEEAFLAHRLVAFDVVETNVSWVDQSLLAGTLNIIEQFCRVKLGAIRDQRVSHVGPLPHQLAAKEAGEVTHDLIPALLSGDHQRHKTAQGCTPDPFVSALVLD
jgi:hypothetical protein